LFFLFLFGVIGVTAKKTREHWGRWGWGFDRGEGGEGGGGLVAVEVGVEVVDH